MSIETIRARLNAATKGPWYEVVGDAETYEIYANKDMRVTTGDYSVYEYGAIENRADADFVAHSRTDLELLLAVAEASKELVEARRDASKDAWLAKERVKAALAALEAAE